MDAIRSTPRAAVDLIGETLVSMPDVWDSIKSAGGAALDRTSSAAAGVSEKALSAGRIAVDYLFPDEPVEE